MTHHPLTPQINNADVMQIAVTRGTTPESVHRVHAAVVTANGEIVRSWGDPVRSVFPRSGCKPLQALPLIETGAADAYHISLDETAIACASHSGTALHVDTVARWLVRLGCGAGHLGCGAHMPYDEATTADFIKAGHTPSTLNNNCSGKHTGMLCTACHVGDPLEGYGEYDHPIQKRIRAAMSDMLDCDLDQAPWGRDGCSIPAMAAPLANWAKGMARLVDRRGLGPARAKAAERIVNAMISRPVLVGGPGQWDSSFMAEMEGRLLVKVGAEGGACGALPEQGLGFVVKVEDGNARAVPVAVATLLKALDIVESEEQLGKLAQPINRNWNGFEVGQIRALAF